MCKNNRMKKLSLILPVFLLLFVAAPAFASWGGDWGNHWDDDNDDCNECPSIEISSDNDADIDNDVTVGANTGRNDANRNRSRGVISTGHALADSLIQNQANSNDTRLDLNWRAGGSVNVSSDNDADVDNDVQVNANTGDNDANKNGRYFRRTRTMGVGNISTGDAQAVSTLTTMVNSNITRVNR
jgi:hypothetical protein